MKIAGSILIILSSITVTFFYEKRLKEQINTLKLLFDFFEYVKNQIEYFSLPLNDIYSKYTSSNSCISDIINGKKVDCLSDEINSNILNLMSVLGKGFKGEQIKNLEYVNVCLDKEIKKYEKEYNQKVKVFRAMALFVGCCTVILLV